MSGALATIARHLYNIGVFPMSNILHVGCVFGEVGYPEISTLQDDIRVIVGSFYNFTISAKYRYIVHTSYGHRKGVVWYVAKVTMASYDLITVWTHRMEQVITWCVIERIYMWQRGFMIFTNSVHSDHVIVSDRQRCSYANFVVNRCRNPFAT